MFTQQQPKSDGAAYPLVYRNLMAVARSRGRGVPWRRRGGGCAVQARFAPVGGRDRDGDVFRIDIESGEE